MIKKQFPTFALAQVERFTGICVIQSLINNQIVSHIWMKEGKWHRIDGPAIINLADTDDTYSGYWINNISYSIEEFLEHPLVIKHKLEMILNSI